MELKFLLFVFLPLFATFGSGAPNRSFGSWPHHGSNYTSGSVLPAPPRYSHGNNTAFIPFRPPGTSAPPIYSAISLRPSNITAPPQRWPGPYLSTVGQGQHGYNSHRYPPNNRPVQEAPSYGANSNQFGNRNNSMGLYPSLAGLGHNGNTYRPPTQGGTRPGTGAWNGTAGSNFPHSYPQHNGHPNYAYGGNEQRPPAQGATGTNAWNSAAGSNFSASQYNGHPSHHNGQAQYNQTNGRWPVNNSY